ncbi:MAG: phosphotransferase [Anaerolineaceae bacterium]|nr:phosphotransferase [Anaerolineaceae bacterium]
MKNSDTDHKLPNLEVTLGHLSGELLRAPRNFTNLVLFKPDKSEKIPPNVVRITHHYADAMLAYGFTAEYEALQRVADWFSTGLSDGSTELDSVEMNRLEALLLLRSQDPNAAARLELLLRQWVVNGRFTSRSSDQRFNALWALKILWLAHQKKATNGSGITQNELRRWTTALLTEDFQDKDMAFALQLRHEIAGGLTKSQQAKYLNVLLSRAAENGGMWGVKRNSGWIIDLIHKQELFNVEFTSNKDRDALREIVISTCYIIENLMPMAEQYPQIKPALRMAMEMWWGVLQGGDTIRKLRTLFRRDYDFLFILFRSLCAIRAYINHPLIQVSAMYLAEQLSSGPPVESSDIESILQALQKWIPVRLKHAPEKLKLGLSDSKVVRVYPQFGHPLLKDEDIDIALVKSVIVKYGKPEEINKERANYKLLPDDIQDAFVEIPQECFEEDAVQGGRAFVIMSDLYRHWTVYETLPRRETYAPAIARELGGFLTRVHRGDTHLTQMYAQDAVMRLYLMPMIDQVRQVFKFIEANDLLPGPAGDVQHLEHELLGLIGGLMPRHSHLEDFPVAYMHGDLHTRNIMVRRLRRADRETYNRELDFKLIDLEKVDNRGDAAHDAGQLLMDLELLRQPRDPDDEAQIVAIMDALTETYTRFADERKDRTFGTRLQLAQARALIRIAKAQIKYGEVALNQNQSTTAKLLARDMLEYVGQSVKYLRAVEAALA